MFLSGLTNFLGFMLGGIRSTGATFLRLPFILPAILVWLLGVFFFLFNAQTLFGANAFQQSIIFLMYIASLGLAFSMSGVKNPLTGMSIAEFGLTFLSWAVVGFLVLKWTTPFTTVPPPLTTESIGLLLTHAFVVAVGEELLFRLVLPQVAMRFRRIPPMAAMVLSAFAFGVMHYSAYGGDWQNILFATGLGIFFGAVTLKFKRGLIIAMALHFAFNAYVLGFV